MVEFSDSEAWTRKGLTRWRRSFALLASPWRRPMMGRVRRVFFSASWM
jgi:hypothetical protein